MKSISFALLSDGSSDAALLPILKWLLIQHAGASVSIQPQWADLRQLVTPPRTLAQSITATARYYPADLLFVHRDAEAEPTRVRHKEIAEAVEIARTEGFAFPYLAVVPIRMQEAWLLVDDNAIRRAAGNPRSRCLLNLPPPERIESLPDPKEVLHRALRQACELRGRRLKKFNVGKATHQVADYMPSFTVLRQLSAFRQLESDVACFIQEHAACHGPTSARPSPPDRSSRSP